MHATPPQAYEQCSWLMAAWQGDFPLTVAGQLQQLVAQLRQRVVALAAACQAPATPEPAPGAEGAPAVDEGPVLQGPVGDLARERSGGLQGGALFGRAPSATWVPWAHAYLACMQYTRRACNTHGVHSNTRCVWRTSTAHCCLVCAHHPSTADLTTMPTPHLPPQRRGEGETPTSEPAPPALTLMLATLLRYMATQLVQHLAAIDASGLLGSPRGGVGESGAAVPEDLAQYDGERQRVPCVKKKGVEMIDHCVYCRCCQT